MLLERSSELAQLHAWLDEADQGTGRLVLVSGEMGIGKTTIVTALARQAAPFFRTITLPFDGLSSPEPLGPVRDLAQRLGLRILPASSEIERQDGLFPAIASMLRESTGTTLIALEDAHWADDASLEFLRFLGRRLSGLRSLVIVTYRDDEQPSRTTLRQVIGDLATEGVTRRLALQPLSLDAVRTLSQGSSLDASALHRFTGGNPFFVTEMLEAGTTTPISIQDSILGRAARLNDLARESIDTASAIGQRVDLPLLASVLDRPVIQDVTDAVNCGLLRFNGALVEFRHAAVWNVIAEALNPLQRQQLHGRILRTLTASPAAHDAARLAHHADLANDLPAAFEWAHKAANQAVLLRSHREAVTQYARALRCGQNLTPEARAELLEEHALACSYTSHVPDAIRSQEAAATIWKTLGDEMRYGRNLWRLSRYWYFDGHYRRASTLVDESHRVLRSAPNTVDYVLASGHLVEWQIRANRLAEARELSELILLVADRLGDEVARVHADITAAMVKLACNDLDGFVALDEARLRAISIGHQEFELRALFYLANTHGTHRQQAASRAWLEARLATLRDADLTTMLSLFGTVRLEALLDRCAWDEAITEADAFLGGGESASRLHLSALLTRARAQLRSGATNLDFSAIANLVARLDDPVASGKLACLHLESIWLNGENAPAMPNLRPADILAAGDAATASELALWLTRTGIDRFDGCDWMVDPYRSELSGDGLQAKAMWDEMESSLLAFRAQSASGDEWDLRAAHQGMVQLGALRDVKRVARLLQKLGVRGIPRGPRLSTRTNAASLSNRELDVLHMLAAGCTDREIAHRLSISEKTVGTHVSAILRKLDVANRTQAAIQARETGLLDS